MDFSKIDTEKLSLNEIAELERRIFSIDLTRIYDEDIVDTLFHTPLMYTHEFKDKIYTNLREQLLHLTDHVFVKTGIKGIQTTERESEPRHGKYIEDTVFMYINILDNKKRPQLNPISSLEEISKKVDFEFDDETKLSSGKTIKFMSPYNTFSYSLLAILTNQNTYLLARSTLIGSEHTRSVDDLSYQSLDNPLNMSRATFIKVYALPKEAFSEMQEKGLVKFCQLNGIGSGAERTKQPKYICGIGSSIGSGRDNSIEYLFQNDK